MINPTSNIIPEVGQTEKQAPAKPSYTFPIFKAHRKRLNGELTFDDREKSFYRCRAPKAAQFQHNENTDRIRAILGKKGPPKAKK